MKLKMKSVCIVAMNKNRKKLMADLQKRGVVEIKDNEQTDGFYKSDTLSQRMQIENMRNGATNALEILTKFAPQKKGLLSSLNGRREITVDDYDDDVKNLRQTAAICADINALQSQLTDCENEIVRLKIAVDELKSYKKLDIPTGFTGTAYTHAFIGAVKGEYTPVTLSNAISQHFSGDFQCEVISSNALQTHIFVITHSKNSEQMFEALSNLQFARVANVDNTLTPAEKISHMTKRMTALETETSLIRRLICDYASDRENIEFLIDFYSMRIDRYREYEKLLNSENAVIITGYITSRDEDKIVDLEKKYNACIIITDPNENDDDVPVELSNNAFSKPAEGILRMYSPPSKKDIDPTAPMSVFFYIFFGLMLSDAGYGLLVVLGCVIALLKFNMEEKMKNNIKLFLYCGISTCFWGVLFGGYFGDLIYRVSDHFFGAPIIVKPLWLDPLKEPLTLLIFGIALGVVHVFAGMIINFINLLRHGEILSAVFDVGLWLLTLSGAVVLAVGLGLGINLTSIAVVMMIAGAVGLVLTQGRDKKGFGKVVSGVASLYDITSYLSDILSYSRIMALGLATGVLAQVVNLLGTMSEGVLGVLMFIVIFLIGTAISLAMNALGAYVHTIRLQYVEFFNKFYEGGGRFFSPFSANTKFIRFKRPKK